MSRINKTPLVSIITPTFNHGSFIEDCIDSVLAQTFEDWEQIIMDDGSTDETYSIALKKAQSCERIKVITQENIGLLRLSETYNKALKQAKGKYIAILEGDDYWDKNKLMLQVAAMEEDENRVVCWGQATNIKSKTKQIISVYPNPNSKESIYFDNKPVGNIMNVFLFNNCIPALTILIRKEAIEKIGGFKQSFNLPLVDFPTLLDLSYIGEFKFIPASLGYYRVFVEQATKTLTSEIANGVYQLRKHHILKCEVERSKVINMSMKEFEEVNKAILIMEYSRSGRYELIRKNFSLARTHYIKSLTSFGFRAPMWKVRSLVGYFFSLFRMDVEFISSIVGKGRIG